MNRERLVIEPKAKSDIQAARDYYSDNGENTSERFRDELTRVFDLLSCNPEAIAVVFGRTRLKPMRCFPYIIGSSILKESSTLLESSTADWAGMNSNADSFRRGNYEPHQANFRFVPSIQ